MTPVEAPSYYRSEKPFVSVVVPCYNEEDSLPELYRRVSRVLKSCTGRYEIILANDGSSDDTLEVIRDLVRKDSHVRGVDLARNFGHQLCLTAALDHARGEVILMMDADLQDPPELLPRMLQRWRDGVDVVYAVRRKRKGENLFKRLTALLFYRLLKMMTKISIPLDTGDFRLIDRRALDAVLSLRETNRFLRGLFSWIGFRQEPIYYVRQERFAGETHYPLGKMMRFALDGITSFSHKPLQFAVWLGLFSAMIAFVYAVSVFWQGIRGGTVSGWASNTFAVLFLGGVQLFTIGLLGEYIGRIFEEVKNRPLYLVREVIEQEEGQEATGAAMPAEVRKREKETV